MTLNNTKQKGFTIVELLIVIVVIAILAAISIVAYNGVTKKANASTAAGNAESVQKAAEAYNADDTANPGGGYPASLAVLTAYNGVTRVPSNVTLKDGTAGNIPTTGNGKTTIVYVPLATPANGGCIVYYDYNNGILASVYAGAAKSVTYTGANTVAAPATAVASCA